MPRDGSGVYTLPSGNPVVTNTLISSSWANPTMSDIAVQLNNVLTRDGVLGPTSPLKLVDGAVATPGLSFNSEPGLGLYRPGASIIAAASGNAKVAQLDSSTSTATYLSLYARSGVGTPAYVLQNAPAGSANFSQLAFQVTGVAASFTQVVAGTGVYLPWTMNGLGFTYTAQTGAPYGTFKIVDTAAGGGLQLVGTGGTTPSKTLKALGGVLYFVNDAQSVAIASLTDAGTFTAVNVAISSDIRYKTDVERSMGAKERIRRLHGYFYKKNGVQEYGLIAQEVQMVYPELVYEDAEGMLAVNYTGLIGELIECVNHGLH